MTIHEAAAAGDIETVAIELRNGIPIDTVANIAMDPDGLSVEELAFRADMPMTPIMAAAHSKRAGPEMLYFLLAQGANPNVVTSVLGSMGLSAVHIACSNPDKLRVLLDAGADPSLSKYGAPPICEASFDGVFDSVRLLLEHGADEAPLKWNALMRAVVLGTLEEVESALKSGAEIEARDHVGRTAWVLALACGDIAKAGSLLDAGADRNCKIRNGTPALAYMIWHNHPIENHRAMIDWMISIGVDVNGTDNFGRTVLVEASSTGDISSVQSLLDAGADPAIADNTKTLPISAAANAGVARLLIEAGSDLNYVDGEGYCLLRRAASTGDVEMVRVLLSLGANTEATRTGETALHSAVGRDQREIISLLLEAGANPNATDADGYTPLHRARSIEAAKALLARGADLLAQDCVGQSALAVQKNIEIQELLIQAGASVNPTLNPAVNSAAGKNGSPLLVAARDGDVDRVSLLIRHGADVDATSSGGYTALMEAAQRSHTGVMRALIEAAGNVDAVDIWGRTALFHAAAPEGFPAYHAYRKSQKVRSSFRNFSETVLPPGAEAVLAAFRSRLATTWKGGYVESDAVDALEILVASGSHVDVRDNEGRTPLSYAASCGRPSRIQALLGLGANPAIPDLQGMTALDHALKHPHEEQRREIVSALTTATQ